MTNAHRSGACLVGVLSAGILIVALAVRFETGTRDSCETRPEVGPQCPLLRNAGVAPSRRAPVLIGTGTVAPEDSALDASVRVPQCSEGRMAALTHLVRDPEHGLRHRSAAARDLGRMGPAAVPLLSGMLTSEPLPAVVRSGAADGLGLCGTSAAIPVLTSALEDTQNGMHTRAAAARALGLLGDAAALPGLHRVAGERGPVGTAARVAIRRLLAVPAR